MKLIERFWSNVHKKAGDSCWEWTGDLDGGGYGRFKVLPGRRDDRIEAHRLAYVLEVGEIPYRMHVCHSCDNRKCVRPAHLFIGTQADNMRDMAGKGRGRGGRISTDTILAIRAAAVNRRETWNQLATRFGVSASMAHMIASRKVYRRIG